MMLQTKLLFPKLSIILRTSEEYPDTMRYHLLILARRFELDYSLAKLKKPYVCILDGNTSKPDFSFLFMIFNKELS
jgi:tRNA uridine 5-carbamoylmethylation protein Kti12